jgi:hypothetical protein
MSTSSAPLSLQERMLQALLEASLPFQNGPDPEVALEALIAAAVLLQERFEQELAELRQEQAE